MAGLAGGSTPSQMPPMRHQPRPTCSFSPVLRLRALLELRHRLVEHYRADGINDPNACRIMPAIVYPSHGRPQCARGGLCTKGPSRLDYLAGRVHLDDENRRRGGHEFMPHPALAQAYRIFRSRHSSRRSKKRGPDESIMIGLGLLVHLICRNVTGAGHGIFSHHRTDRGLYR